MNYYIAQSPSSTLIAPPVPKPGSGFHLSPLSVGIVVIAAGLGLTSWWLDRREASGESAPRLKLKGDIPRRSSPKK